MRTACGHRPAPRCCPGASRRRRRVTAMELDAGPLAGLPPELRRLSPPAGDGRRQRARPRREGGAVAAPVSVHLAQYAAHGTIRESPLRPTHAADWTLARFTASY